MTTRETPTLHEASVARWNAISAGSSPPSWVFDQDKVWYDRWGHEHLIDAMPKDYVLNVLLFLHENYLHRYDPYTAPLERKLRSILVEGMKA